MWIDSVTHPHAETWWYIQIRVCGQNHDHISWEYQRLMQSGRRFSAGGFGYDSNCGEWSYTYVTYNHPNLVVSAWTCIHVLSLWDQDEPWPVLTGELWNWHGWLHSENNLSTWCPLLAHTWTFGARPNLWHQHPLGRVATLDINSISHQVALQRLKCASESIWSGTHLSVSDIYKTFRGLSLSTNQNSYLLFYWKTDYSHLIKQFGDIYSWWAAEYWWKPPPIVICI